MLDPKALQVLTAEDALAALPDTIRTTPASISDDITISPGFKSWVRVYDVDYLGVIGVMTDGMRRFGLPELRMGPASPDLRDELTALLNAMAFRVWSDLLARAQDTPNASGLLHLPRFLRRRPRWTSTAAIWTGPPAFRIEAACSASSGCVSIRRKVKTPGAG